MAGSSIFRSAIKEAIPKLRGPAKQQVRDLRQQLYGAKGLKKDQIDYVLRQFKDPAQRVTRDELSAGALVPKFGLQDEAEIWPTPGPLAGDLRALLPDRDQLMGEFETTKHSLASAVSNQALLQDPDLVRRMAQLARDSVHANSHDWSRFGTRENMLKAIDAIERNPQLFTEVYNTNRSPALAAEIPDYPQDAVLTGLITPFERALKAVRSERESQIMREFWDSMSGDAGFKRLDKAGLILREYPYAEYQRFADPSDIDDRDSPAAAAFNSNHSRWALVPWKQQGYNEKTLVTPDYIAKDYGHYSTPGSVGHIRAARFKRNPAFKPDTYGHFWEDWYKRDNVDGTFIEELQSDAQKKQAQAGPLSQVHEALAKAALYDAVASGEKREVLFPSARVVGDVRDEDASVYASIYDQAVPRALRGVADELGATLSGRPSVDPFYALKLTPEVIKDILERKLPHFKRGGKVRRKG